MVTTKDFTAVLQMTHSSSPLPLRSSHSSSFLILKLFYFMLYFLSREVW